VSDLYVHTFSTMGTVVTLQVVGHGDSETERAERAERVARAAAWFERIEKSCSRFDAGSELRWLTSRVGTPVRVTPTLFEAIRFALAVAESSGGAFDPTVGRLMEAHGFNRNFRTGEVASSVSASGVPDAVSWRDVLLDADAKSVTLLKPLVLDLGAVAKGLAVDVAARELAPFVNFGIDAGGDVYVGGHNADGEPWSVGIRHPREPSLIETLRVSNTAVCTSGDYERKSPTVKGAHHILDARTGQSASSLASVTVVAPTAMVADAHATAAFALGPVDGLQFLERQGVRGLLFTPSLQRFETRNLQ
jgi:thiamine biosynthesis lipoprotein